MGCYIKSFAEAHENGKWVALPVDAFTMQYYGFYGWLGGVRNYSAMVPIAAERGLPPGASRLVRREYGMNPWDNHSVSWVGMDELLTVDYDQIVEDRRVTVQTGQRSWNGGATCESGQGQKMTLREFLSEQYFQELLRIQSAGAERIVFWFQG